MAFPGGMVSQNLKDPHDPVDLLALREVGPSTPGEYYALLIFTGHFAHATMRGGKASSQ